MKGKWLLITWFNVWPRQILVPHLILFVTIYTPRTSKFNFYNNEERIFGKILNYQITLANRLSRAFSGGQENPALQNYILDETMKCLADLRRM